MPAPAEQSGTWSGRLDLAGAWMTSLFPLAIVAGQAVMDIAGCVLAGLFLLRSAWTRDFTWLRERWVQLVLALWLYGVARSVFTPDPSWSLHRAVPWGRYVLIGIAFACWGMRLHGAWPRMMRWLAAAVAFLVLDGLFQAWLGHDVFGRPVEHTSNGTWRLTGPYGKPMLGIMLAWLSLPALAWLYQRQQRPWHVHAAAALLLLTVFLSGERMALLLTMAGLAMFSWLLRVPYRHAAAFSGLALLAALAAVSWQEPIVQRQLHGLALMLGDAASTHYYRLWASGVQLWLQQPLFGIGINRFVLDCPALYGASSIMQPQAAPHCAEHLHHLYLEWLTYGGLVAFALLSATIVLWLRRILAAGLWRADPLAAAWLIALGLRVLPLSTSPSLYTSWAGVPFWFIAAAALVAGTRPPSERLP